MRRSLFLYLFVFAMLIVVIQYVNSRKMLESKNEEITDLQTELTENKIESDSLSDENYELQYFSLLKNDKAMGYLEDMGFEAANIQRAIEDGIIDQNSAEGNPLVPYEGMSGSPMNINKIKVLNHKWVIANFSDGKYWGEILLSYQINDNQEMVFNVEESLLYPPN